MNTFIYSFFALAILAMAILCGVPDSGMAAEHFIVGNGDLLGSVSLASLAVAGVVDRDTISSRAIQGMYYQALEGDAVTKYLDRISNFFTSDQESETYPWIGMPPQMREWIGGRQSQQLSVNGVTLTNVHYEATMEIKNKDRRRDKTKQIQARVGEFAQRGQTHFGSLLSSLIVGGASNVCYDGQYFFDTDHSEGKSGVQSNSITCAIAAQPASVHGSVTAPSPEEMQQAIMQSIAKMYSFVDEHGEPLNEPARDFTVIVPTGLYMAAVSAVTMPRVAGVSVFDVMADGLNISIAANPRLTIAGWTSKFVTVRSDGFIKPFIRQEETAPELKTKGDGSDYEFDNDAIQLGIDSWRTVGYGRWQGAVLQTLV